MTASVVSGPTPESNRPPARYSQSPRKAKVRRFEARSPFAVAEEAGIDSIATYLWAIRNGHSNARRQPSPHRHLRAEHGSHGQRHQRRRTEGPSTQGRGWILG